MQTNSSIEPPYEPAWSALMEHRAGARILRQDDGGELAAVARDARALAQARLDLDRWVDEGGLVPFEAAALLRATTS